MCEEAFQRVQVRLQDERTRTRRSCRDFKVLPAGERDDDDVIVRGPDVLDDVQRIAIGKPEVYDDDERMPARDERERPLPVLRGFDLVAPDPKQRAERIEVVGVVVDNENAPGRHDESILRLGVTLAQNAQSGGAVVGASSRQTPGECWQPYTRHPGARSPPESKRLTRYIPECDGPVLPVGGRALRMPDQLVTFDHVAVLQRGKLGFRCRVAGRVVWVGYLQPEPGTTVDRLRPGDRLVLRRADAAKLGLIDRKPAASQIADHTLADDVARHVLAGTAHPAVHWLEERTAFMLRLRHLIPDSYLPETRERRRQVRVLLRERLPGWCEMPGNKWLPLPAKPRATRREAR